MAVLMKRTAFAGFLTLSVYLALNLLVTVPGVALFSAAISGETANESENSRFAQEVSVVVADDDPTDLAAMATAAQSVIAHLGFRATVISCLNDFECIRMGALNGGTRGSQAVAVFLDGGFIGMQLPSEAPFPPVPARTVNGRSFSSGPWIASYLRQLGYKGAVIYVSTEGWNVIKEFRGQGADLGPTYKKEWFFSNPTRFAGEIKLRLPK